MIRSQKILSAMVKDRRLRELRSKEQLSDDEMRELIELAEPGELISLPSFESMGLLNLDKALKNLGEIMERAEKAENAGFFLETISLRVQHMEFWLRMFWAARNAKGKIFGPTDKRTFGQVIHDCERLGFDPAIADNLRRFNTYRREAIHKLLLGATDYEELRFVCKGYCDLPKLVGEYVRGIVGIALKR